MLANFIQATSVMRQLIASAISSLLIIAPCALAKETAVETFTAEQQLEIEKVKNELSSKLQDNNAHCLQLTEASFEDICEAYQHAAFLDVTHPTYHNWGLALSHWATTLKGSKQQQRFSEANIKFTEADILESENIETLRAWGGSLSTWAKTLNGAQQQDLFREAYEKCAEADRIKPNNPKILDHLGLVLMNWGHSLTGEARQQRLTEAKNHLLAAGEVGYYNFAWWNAIQGNIDETKKYLELCEITGQLPNPLHLDSDPDLANLQDLDWFKDLLARAKA